MANATGGIYTHIDDGDENLITAMSSYYLYYAYGDDESNNDLVVTSPYLDFGTGMAMVTMALPVYFEEHFVGVVGIDIPLTFLSEAIGEVVLGRQSYSFIVNQENEVILHPLVPDPLTTMFSVGDSYKPVYIDDLEPVEFDTSLLWSGSGTQKITGTVKQPVCFYLFFSSLFFFEAACLICKCPLRCSFVFRLEMSRSTDTRSAPNIYCIGTAVWDPPLWRLEL